MKDDENTIAGIDHGILNGLLDATADDSLVDPEFMDRFGYIWMQILGDFVISCTAGNGDFKVNLFFKDKFKDAEGLDSNLFTVSNKSCGEVGVTCNNKLYLTFRIAGEHREFTLDAADIDINLSNIESKGGAQLPIHWCINAVVARLQFSQHKFVDPAKLPKTVTNVNGNVISADFTKGRV